MKTIVALFFLVSLNVSSVSKSHLPYGVLVTKAEHIVHGKISKIDNGKEQYQFKVIDAVKGKTLDTIDVKIWKEWICDKRVSPLKVGQELLLFLKGNKNEPYSVIHGSKGELFVSEKDYVTTFQYSLKDNKFPKIFHLKKGIKLFNRAFKYHGELYGFDDGGYFVRKANGSMIKKLNKENKFFRMAYNSIKYCEIKI